jgi:hypothetical protein
MRVDAIIHGEVKSTCTYWVPLKDWNGETVYLKARGVNYIATLPGKENPPGIYEQFPQLISAWDEQAEKHGPDPSDDRLGQLEVDACAPGQQADK